MTCAACEQQHKTMDLAECWRPDFYSGPAKQVEGEKLSHSLYPQMVISSNGRKITEGDVNNLVVRVFPADTFRHSADCLKFDWSYMPVEPTEKFVLVKAVKVIEVGEKFFKFEKDYLGGFPFEQETLNDGHWLTAEEYLKMFGKEPEATAKVEEVPTDQSSEIAS